MNSTSQIDDPKSRGILVVDDDPGPRVTLKYVLQSKQYSNLHFATDGVDALEKLEVLGSSVHVILLDMRMPRMDGLTFLKRLGEQDDGHPVGVIVMTGYPTPSGRQEVFKMETKRVRPLDYLAKPFEMNVVLDGVAKSLDAIHQMRSAV